MKEIHEFRIFKDYYHLLPPNNARFNGAAYVLYVSKDDPLFQAIGSIDQDLRKKQEFLFSSWQVRRTYTPEEWAAARLFLLQIRYAFEPVGEQCGTVYDEEAACQICGAGRKQIGPLKLKKGSIPKKKDISRTIADEMVVSERFAEVVRQRGLKGIKLEPVVFAKEVAPYYQLAACSPPLELSEQTAVGFNPFNLSNETQEAQEFTVSGSYKIRSERLVLKCPTGHLVGAGLISEPWVLDSPVLSSYDFFATRQMIGGKLGVFRPESVYLCSPAFRQMVLEEKLLGFTFEVAHVV